MAIYNFHRSDLLTQEWEKLNDENNHMNNYPFHINNDGFTIFVKDKTQKIAEFSEEDKKRLGILNQKGKKGTTSYKPALEKGVKITVKKLEDCKDDGVKVEEVNTQTDGKINPNEPVKKVTETIFEQDDLQPLGD